MLQSLRGIGRQAHPPEVLCSLMLQTRVFQPRLRDFHAVNGYLPPRGALRALELGWQRLVPCVSNLRRSAVCAIGGDAISGLSATTERDRGFADSLLEGDRFEPSFPREDEPRKGAVDPLTPADSKAPHRDRPAARKADFFSSVADHRELRFSRQGGAGADASV